MKKSAWFRALFLCVSVKILAVRFCQGGSILHYQPTNNWYEILLRPLIMRAVSYEL